MGYFKVPNWYVDTVMPLLGNKENRLMLFYMRASDAMGKSFYSNVKIAKILDISRNKINDARKWLADNGYIKVRKCRGHSDTVFLNERFVDDTKKEEG